MPFVRSEQSLESVTLLSVRINDRVTLLDEVEHRSTHQTVEVSDAVGDDDQRNEPLQTSTFSDGNVREKKDVPEYHSEPSDDVEIDEQML